MHLFLPLSIHQSWDMIPVRIIQMINKVWSRSYCNYGNMQFSKVPSSNYAQICLTTRLWSWRYFYLAVISWCCLTVSGVSGVLRNHIRSEEHYNYEAATDGGVPIRLSDSEILFELPVNTLNTVVSKYCSDPDWRFSWPSQGCIHIELWVKPRLTPRTSSSVLQAGDNTE